VQVQASVTEQAKIVQAEKQADGTSVKNRGAMTACGAGFLMWRGPGMFSHGVLVSVQPASARQSSRRCASPALWLARCNARFSSQSVDKDSPGHMIKNPPLRFRMGLELPQQRDLFPEFSLTPDQAAKLWTISEAYAFPTPWE